MPLWLLPALDACSDLGVGAPWHRVREWSEHHGIDFDWLYGVMQLGASALHEFTSKQLKAKRAAPRSRTNSRS